MKIVSWNCNGKFREKINKIKELDADIYVIQECENPEFTKNQSYKDFSAGGFWTGKIRSKGLGIFFREPSAAVKSDWHSCDFANFLPVDIDEKLSLLAVWACKPYIEGYYDYQNLNFDNYKNKDIIVIGDFNSNAMWDDKHRKKSHSAVVDELQSIGIYSVYHRIMNEEHGKEKQNTFYMHRNKSKGYHIDYCFTNIAEIKNFIIFDNSSWLEYSDHMPILVEI